MSTLKSKATKAVAIKLIGDNAIAKESINLARAIKGMDKRVQTYLCSEIAHIEAHRNPTRLNAFFDAIAKRGVRTHAMHSFIQTFANVRYDEESKKYVMNAKRDDAIAKEKLALAMTSEWTTFKPEGKVRQFNLEQAASRFLFEAFKNGIELEAIEAAIAKVKTDAAKKAAEVLAKAAMAEDKEDAAPAEVEEQA